MWEKVKRGVENGEKSMQWQISESTDILTEDEEHTLKNKS